MRGDWYQVSLIFLGVVATALFGAFFYRELFPEYKIYQNAYAELEQFRSTYTGEPPPPFEWGVKQILIENENKGPAVVDRCISCHVAMQFSHFSPTKIATDINGNMIYDEKGAPVQEPNEEYVWAKLEEKVAFLEEEGKTAEAEKLKELKTVEVGEYVYDMTKVLRMHPLMGRETRPFEFHPIDTYGCTSCHNGNGLGLVTDRAHGPVFDGQYEEMFMGPEPQFLEPDPENDPSFARVFNHKPGHRLLFQTNPIFVGPLIQANCVQCHQSSPDVLQDVARETEVITDRRIAQSKAIQEAFAHEQGALRSLLELRERVEKDGYESTIQYLRQRAEEFTLSGEARDAAQTQLSFLLRTSEGETEGARERAIEKLDRSIVWSVGDPSLSEKLVASKEGIETFIAENRNDPGAVGALFTKKEAVDADQKALFYVENVGSAIDKEVSNEKVQAAITSEIDALTQDFHQGKELFLSQACYACHRINGLTRGGVGPELTEAGDLYPWYIKESIVWPQADLKSSTMPNFHIDHDDLEQLTTFLLAQKGRSQATSETNYKAAMLKWEAGYKMPWERPINPGKLHDLRYSMTVFATEGCASCHKLKGFESNVGFLVEKEGDPEWNTLHEERTWFQDLFPEESIGSQIVQAVEENQEEIDRRIVDGVREDSLLEELEEEHPGLISSYNNHFNFAFRAKNHEFETLAAQAKDPEEKEKILQGLQEWKERVRRVMMMYVQEYGLGRLVGPRPNWSGIYRSDEWLIEHFRKPSRHIARSIMPVLPFDDSKFYALTYMLDELAIRNRNEVREIWENQGFDPELAYQIHCSQCHGEFLHGNGPVAEWIYPIPKNLRNADFLRNFTKENVISSIVHGVKGTPMPPWGEVATDKPTADGIPVLTENEIKQLVDWLFSSLLGGTVIRSEEDVPKWQYKPEDILDELEKEGNTLDPGPPPEFIEMWELEPDFSALWKPEWDQYSASLEPTIGLNGQEFGRVGEVFDIYPNPIPSSDKYVYYIKKQYYTGENIQDGKNFFELNCAVCHGKEADGAGYRAGTMYDAKPRMLTNLHWIHTRDDLRLLRSVKYGVIGTSMTPWGDLTSALQRLQLVIYIRSLSLEQEQRDALFNVLYRVFDRADQVIDTARIDENQRANQLQEKLNTINAQRAELTPVAEPTEVAALYQEEIKLTRHLRERKEADQTLLELKKLIKEEGHIYQTLGITLIGKTLIGDAFDRFLKLVQEDNAHFEEKEGKLLLTFNQEKEKEIRTSGEQLIQSISEQIRSMERDKVIVEGKLPSPERKDTLDQLNGNLISFGKIRDALVEGFEKAARLRQQQKELYRKYTEKIEQLKAIT